MPESRLDIITNLGEVIGQVNGLTEEQKKATDGVRNYQQASTGAFKKPADELKALNKRIKEQERLLKEVMKEEERLNKAKREGERISNRQYKRTIADAKQYRAELDQMRAKQGQLTAQMQKTESAGMKMFKRLGAMAAGAFSVVMVTRFFNAALTAYDKQVRSETKLLIALKGREDIQKRLIKQAKDLQKITLFGDEQTIEAQARLVRLLGNNEDAIRALMPLIQDFATAQEMDLAGAAELVAKSLGTSTNALSRYGIMLKSPAGSAERLTELVKQLNEQVGGQAEAAAEIGTGAVTKMKNAWGDFSETIGAALSPALIKVADWAKRTTEYWDWGLTKVQERGGKFIDWWHWFWQTADFGSEVFYQEQEINKWLDLSNEGLAKWVAARDAAAKTTIKLQDAAAMTNAELVRLERELTAIKKEELTEQQEDLLKSVQWELNIRRKKIMEEIKIIRERFELEENNDFFRQEAHKRFIKRMEDEQDALLAAAAAAAEYERRLSQSNSQFRKVVNDWKDEEYIDDIPWDTEAWVKEYEQLNEFTEQNPIWAALGFTDEEQIAAAKDAVNMALGWLQDLYAAQVENTTRIVQDYDTRIAEIQRRIDQELRLKGEGLANDYDMQVKQYEEEKKLREKAIKDRDKAIRQQQTLESIMQSVNLATSVSQILAQFTGMGPWGIALAAVAIGALFAIWADSKKKASATTKYGKGGLLEGLSHSKGGIKIPDSNVELEGKEFITNKRSTGKYLPLLDAINRDDRNAMERFIVNREMNHVFSPVVKIKDIDDSKLLSDIKSILSRDEQLLIADGYMIERRGGYTKKTKLR